MAERQASPETPGPWERWTHVSHRYILPVVAGTAFTFGAALLSDYQPRVIEYLPGLLIAVGAVGLSTSFAFLATRRRAAVARQAPAPGAHDRARPVRAPFAHREPLDRSPTVRPGTSWPTAFARTDCSGGNLTTSGPGDKLWHEWLSTEAEALGAEIIGPVPETAYFGRPSGGADPFPYREEDLLFLDELAQAAEGDDPPGAFALNGPKGWMSGSIAAPDLSRTLVEQEALAALPPELRARAVPSPRPRLPEAAPGAARPSKASDSCSTCLVTLEGPRWQACPGCFQPICPDCVVDSLASYGATGCAGCAQGRPMGP